MTDPASKNKPNGQNGGETSGNGYQTKAPWYGWLKWGDYLMYGLIGGLAIFLFLFMPRISGIDQAGAVLLLDNQVIESWTAADLAGHGERSVTAYDYQYAIHWENGRIAFATAGCPDQICVRTGWISRRGEIAACVPGHLILKIIAGSDNPTDSTNDVDVIVK